MEECDWKKILKMQEIKNKIQ